MAAGEARLKEPGVRDVVITRGLDASRETVFRWWTEPVRVMRWWGPKSFTAPVVKIDLKAGGKFLGCMRSPEGKDFWSTGTYLEILAPERLVMTDSFADQEGNVVPSSHYGMAAAWPLEMLVTVTFELQGDKTKMTLRHSRLGDIDDANRNGMIQGWSESFDKLAVELANEKAWMTVERDERKVVMTRTFRAPVETVWNTMTNPVYVPMWWGPKEFATEVRLMDVRPGGRWRYVQTGPDGATFGFHGLYREILPQKLLSYSFEFEPMPGHESLETIRFEALGERTKVTNTVLYPSVEDLDGALSSGMEKGARESMDRFENLLETLKPSKSR